MCCVYFFTSYMSSSCLFPGSPLCFLMKAATVQEITSEAREEFPLDVCVHLGVAVLLLVSANWSECTKNSLFLGNLSTLSGKMNVLRIRACHLQPVTREPAWVMHVRASARLPSRHLI